MKERQRNEGKRRKSGKRIAIIFGLFLVRKEGEGRKQRKKDKEGGKGKKEEVEGSRMGNGGMKERQRNGRKK